MSSETKFSPAPWRKNRFGELKDANGENVSVWDAGIGYSSRSERTEANASLIDHAAELYEALESAAVHLEEMRKDEKWHPVGKCPVLDMVRAVMSRARGEEPAGGADAK